jgi:hypothetical protein
MPNRLLTVLNECEPLLGEYFSRVKENVLANNWDAVQEDLQLLLEKEYSQELDYLYSLLPGRQITVTRKI